jgi:ketosteroid isomerase-like protein
MASVIKGVTLNTAITAKNPVARANIDTIVDFFSVYLKDKAHFYSLWVEDEPQVITPFVSDDIAVCTVAVHSGWDAVKAFWDPIHDEMTGTFDWFIDEIIAGEDPDTIITKSNSYIDVQTGAVWGSKPVKYRGRYVQIFKFEQGKVKSFEEYYDTALLNSVYGA